MTPADVQRVARKYLPDDLRVVDQATCPRAPSRRARPPRPRRRRRSPRSPTPARSPRCCRRPSASRRRRSARSHPPCCRRRSSARCRTACGSSWRKSTDLPLVAASLSLEAGAASDPPHLAGDASLTASLVTEGTATRSARDIARQSEALGADLGASSSWESSQVGLSVMPDKLAGRARHRRRRRPQPHLRARGAGARAQGAAGRPRRRLRRAGRGGLVRHRAGDLRRHLVRPRRRRHAELAEAAHPRRPGPLPRP